jgi:sterol desaturase/sphingolipid hydroxylase (fatty acid hydroxylase superfamily)
VDADQVALSRFLPFLGLMVLFMGAEALWPRRRRVLARARRWPGNLGILLVDGLAVRAVVALGPILAPVALAHWGAEHGWGLLPLFPMPSWLALVLGVLALDLTIWAQHLAFHKLAPLWRLHRMHHADLEYDVTTALRFHPLEILLSQGVKLGAVLVLGPSALAVLVFEILLNGSAMFNHANLRLPLALDRVLRLVIVTPDMHRVHHSPHREETDSNYGFCFPWWDRLFGTYRAQPREGHEAMTIGLETLRDPRELGLWRLLTQPFR